jgi:Holliday junction resolvase RusA-like endonuclease
MISIDIIGNPIPWKRPGRKLISGKIISYDKQHKEKEATQWQIRSQYRNDPFGNYVPLHVDMTFYMPIPKNVSRKVREQMLHDYIKFSKRPDLDNLCKYVMDCMTGIVFPDDAAINELTLRKVYSLRPATLRIIPYSDSPEFKLPEVPVDDGWLDDDEYL